MPDPGRPGYTSENKNGCMENKSLWLKNAYERN